MGIFSFFNGNRNHDGGKKNVDGFKTIPIPDGVCLTEFYISEQGMAMQPRYMMKKSNDGVYMKISNLESNCLQMLEGEDSCDFDDRLLFIDVVKDCEHASSVKLSDDAPVRELEKVIAESGSLSWDGYNKHKSMRGVLDSGDSYELYMSFSDKSTVNVNSYNSHPANWNMLMGRVKEIFESHADYSRYMTSDFFASECEYMLVEFYDYSVNCSYKLELKTLSSKVHWSVYINDREGKIIGNNTCINDYADTDDLHSYDGFLTVIDKYCEEKWNGRKDNDGTYNNRIYMVMDFKDGKSYQLSGNMLPVDYSAFRDEFVKTMYDFRCMDKGKDERENDKR